MDYAKKYRLDLKLGEDFIIMENHRLAHKLGSEIIVIGRKMYCSGELEEVPRHEYLHIAQYKKYGTILVLLHYWFYITINLLRFWNFKKAFQQVPFEQEAREFEAIENTGVGVK